jgi:hypothetical protein
MINRPMINRPTIDRPTIDRPSGLLVAGSQAVRKIKLAFRVAVNLVERSRTGAAVLAGFRATAHSLGRVLHQLWLEVTGFTFLAMAGVGAMAGIREYGKYQSGHATGPGRLLLAVCFTVSFTWFGLSSFWRVKRRANS